jgi:tetratricopeptide (TPR) repeat protein
MKLNAALGASLRYTRSAIPEMGAAWTRTLKIAEELDEAEYQLRALSGLWIFHTANEQHRVALELAQRLRALAATRPDPNDRLVGERLIGTSQHFLGDQESARRHLERVLAEYTASDRRSHIVRFQYDLRVTARALLARILWRQGFPDQAMRAAEESIAEARASNHAMSLCYALVHAACPVSLWTGDLAAAEHYIGMLLDHSTRYALTFWHAFGLGYQGALAVRRGDVTTGLRLLRAGFEALREPRSALRFISFLGEVAEALGRAGQSGAGLATIDETIARSEHTEERWWTTDLLRVRGELLLLQDEKGAAAVAEDYFRQALDWARRQGALSWELRAATSLARLLRDQGRAADASALLQPVYDRFIEGFGTADLIAAKNLLDETR